LLLLELNLPSQLRKGSPLLVGGAACVVLQDTGTPHPQCHTQGMKCWKCRLFCPCCFSSPCVLVETSPFWPGCKTLAGDVWWRDWCLGSKRERCHFPSSFPRALFNLLFLPSWSSFCHIC